MAKDEYVRLEPPLTTQLCAYVASIEKLSSEIDKLTRKKADLYAEARACGLHTGTVRKVVRRRALTPAQRRKEDEKKVPYDLLLAYEGIVNGN